MTWNSWASEDHAMYENLGIGNTATQAQIPEFFESPFQWGSGPTEDPLFPNLKDQFLAAFNSQGSDSDAGGSYGRACYVFAVRWARAMENAIEAGESLSACADRCMTQADNTPGMGITGFMYGMAVQILSHWWKHGEELRVWHNAQYGKTSGSGVVNPALMTVEIGD